MWVDMAEHIHLSSSAVVVVADGAFVVCPPTAAAPLSDTPAPAEDG